MTFDEILIEVLDRGLDDWIDVAEVMGIVVEFGDWPQGPEQDEWALALIRTLLEQGMMVAGDLSEEGFREWGLSPDAAFARIEREWRALGRSPALHEIGWLSNTEHGDAFARA